MENTKNRQKIVRFSSFVPSVCKLQFQKVHSSVSFSVGLWIQKKPICFVYF